MTENRNTMCAEVDAVQAPIACARWLLRRCTAANSLAVVVACSLILSSVYASAGAETAASDKPGPGGEPAGQASRAGPPAVIDGFRDAHFGMTEDEVRRAIHKDFPGPAAKLKSMTHPSEKTTILTLAVPDLIPNTGIAQVSCILGHKSRKLIQVNVVWHSDGSKESDETVVGAANSLRDYFATESYKPGSEITNRQLGKDAIIVFRGADGQDRTVVMILSGSAAAGHKEAKVPPLTLELSYIADPAHPDVFRIGKGQF